MLYVDDLTFDDMLHGVTVRSSVARGRIKNISFAGDLPWNEFTIVTAKDIPGENYVALLINDQPYLADKVVNHPEEPILLLAHHDRYLLEEARRHVEIEYEELPPVFSLQDALAKEVIWGEQVSEFRLTKAMSMRSGPGRFHRRANMKPAQEQLYIENNGAISISNPDDGARSGDNAVPVLRTKL